MPSIIKTKNLAQSNNMTKSNFGEREREREKEQKKYLYINFSFCKKDYFKEDRNFQKSVANQ